MFPGALVVLTGFNFVECKTVIKCNSMWHEGFIKS